MSLALLSLFACVPSLYTDGAVGDWSAPENSWPSEAPPADVAMLCCFSALCLVCELLSSVQQHVSHGKILSRLVN